MSLLQLRTTPTLKDDDGDWYTYADDGDGAVRFRVRPWTRTSQADVDRLAKDKRYIESLGIDWEGLPKGSGNRRVELHTIVLAEYLLADWEGLVGDDGATPLPCTLTNKIWAFESVDLAVRILEWAKEGGAKLVGDEAGN